MVYFDQSTWTTGVFVGASLGTVGAGGRETIGDSEVGKEEARVEAQAVSRQETRIIMK